MNGLAFLAGVTPEELERERSVRLRLPEPSLPFAGGGFGTPDGKRHFHAESLDYAPDALKGGCGRQINSGSGPEENRCLRRRPGIPGGVPA